NRSTHRSDPYRINEPNYRKKPTNSSTGPGQPMKYPSTYELFQRLAKKAGFAARPHMLRHSAITRWRREGKPDYLIMDMAGHVSRQSIDQYTHASDQEKRDAVNHVAALGKART
ncbi:tyrosine-type recombinase/integrase, partial [Streptomyces sp. TRM68367]|uniref:tyrosine-type recombinase/integrase n=1 Tax=Streptomyces sp. TRM68367 TaxID=2758415 RepID=UPI00165CD7CA